MNVIQSLYNEPEKWRQKDHTLDHVDGARVWTSNVPFFDTNMFPSVRMSMANKWRLYKAVKWWGNNAPIEAFNRK